MNQYVFNVTQPWGRCAYTHKGKTVGSMLLTDTIDFRSKVKASFEMAVLAAQLSGRLPSSDPMAIWVGIESPNRCKPLFVVKNILDSLAGAAFNNDTQVQSILATQRASLNNKVSVSLLINKHLRCEADIARQQALLQFEVAMCPVDYIIPTKKSFAHTISQNADNAVAMSLITDELCRQGFSGTALSSVPKLSIDISTRQIRADIDNIGIMYLLALNTLLYTEIECIDSIIVNLDRRSGKEEVLVTM